MTQLRSCVIDIRAYWKLYNKLKGKYTFLQDIVQRERESESLRTLAQLQDLESLCELSNKVRLKDKI